MLDTIIIDAKDCNDGTFKLTTANPIVAIIQDGTKLTIDTLRPNGLLDR